MKPLSVDAEQVNDALVHRLLTPSRGQGAVLTAVEGYALRHFVEDYTAARIDWGRDTDQRDRAVDVQTVLSPTTYRFLTTVFDEWQRSRSIGKRVWVASSQRQSRYADRC